ncbi:MAG: glycosyltransferase [Ignavibacteriae bacterium]|nr:glycosyltransferase [Ignavibacteria bacterium]MBI3365133.1 glycosyltransferase [Ignavibacteriota bacterium]
MKILILSTAFPLRGGIAHFNALLASYLRKRHEVQTITFKRQYPTMFFPGKSQEETGELFTAEAAPQLMDSINPLNWIRVAREVRRLHPDLIIFKYWLPFFGPCFGTIAKLAKRGSGTKVLFICDNILPHERRPGDVVFTRYAFKQADCFIVQSHTVERDLVRLFPSARYKMVPHPVYEIFGKPMDKQAARSRLGISATKVLLFFGYIRAYKGLLVLIEAVSKLVDQGMTDIALLAVGEFYDDEVKYHNRVKELNIESAVRFVSDYVPNEDVGLYFSAADVVVLPYLSATQSGIAQIAYNFDKPVIATNVGGLSEVVVDQQTGFIVSSNNPDELARSIARFYAETKEEEFVANVRREKRKYSWDRLVEAIEELSTSPAH